MTDDQMASKKLCFFVLEESVTVDDVAGGLNDRGVSLIGSRWALIRVSLGRKGVAGADT